MAINCPSCEHIVGRGRPVQSVTQEQADATNTALREALRAGQRMDRDRRAEERRAYARDYYQRVTKPNRRAS